MGKFIEYKPKHLISYRRGLERETTTSLCSSKDARRFRTSNSILQTSPTLDLLTWNSNLRFNLIPAVTPRTTQPSLAVYAERGERNSLNSSNWPDLKSWTENPIRRAHPVSLESLGCMARNLQLKKHHPQWGFLMLILLFVFITRLHMFCLLRNSAVIFRSPRPACNSACIPEFLSLPALCWPLGDGVVDYQWR